MFMVDVTLDFQTNLVELLYARILIARNWRQNGRSLYANLHTIHTQ